MKTISLLRLLLAAAFLVALAACGGGGGGGGGGDDEDPVDPIEPILVLEPSVFALSSGDLEFAVAWFHTLDIDGNGIIDVDVDGDGIADVDVDSDGIVDVDVDDNGVFDVDVDGDGIVDVDIDGDGVFDVDSDGDGIIDLDVDGDGVFDVDVDGDGIIDVDVDGDGIVDVDVDGDGIIDVDVDGDGIVDITVDVDGDGIADGIADGFVAVAAGIVDGVEEQFITYDFYYASDEIELGEDEEGNTINEDLSLEDLLARFNALEGSVLLEDADTPLTINTGLENETAYYFVITATTDVDGVLETSAPSGQLIVVPRGAQPLVEYGINDTGYAECADYSFVIDVNRDGLDQDDIDNNLNSFISNNHIDCLNGATDPEGDLTPNIDLQDAFTGRDNSTAIPALTKVGAGMAGFDFTKLDANGNALDASATEWSCVEDNHTGFIWESKTTSDDLHNTADRYTWYNTDELSNGGFDGFALASDFDTSESNNTCFGYVEGDEATYCNSEAFVARVNAAGLCGANDWQLPSREEALGLIHFQLQDPETSDSQRPLFGLSIDTDFFPNTEVSVVTDSFQNARYMTRSPYAFDNVPLRIWGVFFGSGSSPALDKGEINPIRLVRAAP